MKKVTKCMLIIFSVFLIADLICWSSTGNSIIAEQLLVGLMVGFIFYAYAIAESVWYIAAMVLTALLSGIPAYLLQKHLPADVKYLSKVWPLFCFMLCMAALKTWTFWAAAFYLCVVPAILGIAAVETNRWSAKKSEEAWNLVESNDGTTV